MIEKPNPGVIPDPNVVEEDFTSVFEEVNTEKDPLEIEYENFKVLMKNEKLNVFSALLDYENGKRKPLADIYTVHPELGELLDEELASKSIDKRNEFLKLHPEAKKLSTKELGEKIKGKILQERQELLNRYKKEVIGIIYQNLVSLKNSLNLHPGDLNLLLDNGNEFLQLFEELKQQNPGQKKDYFIALEEYLKAKQEAERTDNPEKVAMSLFFLNNEPLEKLIPKLDKLSRRLGKDVITNLVSRPENEKKLTELSRKTEPIREIFNFYGTANDHLFALLDNFSSFSKLYKDQSGEVPESLSMFKDTLDMIMKNELRQINRVKEARKLAHEIEGIKNGDEHSEAAKRFRKLNNSIIDMGEYRNYKDMPAKELEKARVEYETVLALPERQILDLQLLSSLGELIEKRFNYFNDVLGQHAELSKKYRTEYDWH